VKVFVFMTHRIRQRRPRLPVIRVQGAGDTATFTEGNTVAINGPCIVRYDPRGLPFADEHRVTAWIEADERDVVVK
jgi:hypothetical protein